MLSITILTKNSGRLIGEVLQSVEWAPEVVVFDTGSADHTLDVATSFENVTIHCGAFTDFGALHNQMAALASHDWIFSLDSDETVSPELATELQAVSHDPRCVYSIPRRNYFNGKWIRGCGWWPDRVIRLYHRGHTHFSNDKVHERVLTEGMQVTPLTQPINHFSYTSISQFLKKMQLYSDLFAHQHHHEKRSSLWRALASSWVAFIRSYFLQLGFRDGYEGFVISTYNAQTAYYKYLKLRELNQDSCPKTRR